MKRKNVLNRKSFSRCRKYLSEGGIKMRRMSLRSMQRNYISIPEFTARENLYFPVVKNQFNQVNIVGATFLRSTIFMQNTYWIFKIISQG